jgi:hypothetical protein
LILSLVQHESSKVAGGSRKIFRDTIAFPIWSFMTCPHAKCDASPHWIVKFRYLFSNKMDAILPFLFFNGTEGWTKNIIVWFTTVRIPTYTKKMLHHSTPSLCCLYVQKMQTTDYLKTVVICNQSKM